MKTFMLAGLAAAQNSDFQLYLPPDRAGAFDGAETSFSFPQPSQNLATCLWVKSTFPDGGEVLRLSDTESGELNLSVSVRDNSVLLSNKLSSVDFSFSQIDLRDFRWHQICTDCTTSTCTVYLDGKDSEVQPFSFPTSQFSSVNVNFGFASGFQGKIQKFRISNSENPVESATACGAPVKQLSNAQSWSPAELLITRPVHTRDYESVCNDLLSVDCGLDSITVSVSHLHLETIGLHEKFKVSRLSVLEHCANFTSSDFTTFTIAPLDACGSKVTISETDRTVSNTVLNYANDGTVFTADFQCQYPIDVTAVEYVEPVKEQDVIFQQKIVPVGLVRYDSNSFQEQSRNALELSRGEILHLAALAPDEIDRSIRVLVKSCETAKGVSLLSDFGCNSEEETSYVYTNGDSPAARFSLAVPEWTVDVRCSVILCDKGDECEVKCGKGKSRIRRTPEGDDLTTQAPYIPLETTAAMEIEENWEEKKETFEDLVETKLVFGPLEWPREVQTTAVPEADFVTEMPEEDEIATTEMPIEEILETEELEIIEEKVKETVEVIVEDIKKVVVEVEDGTIAGSTAMWTIMLSSCGALSAGIAMLFKFYQNKKRENLISS
ncbi:Oidioi.mRNA.OKI2018_I69.chr1.g3767.t1.cds [Oikopleura dioica]|uniref:Oidioi.mRNA.OKI2018_I69.chr1.g3767.t1.cds n=1 Tax=Oikopleura dioica TaxID=34765 RepID=A0ABN7T0Q1_OIKDI|nr:Oidioi.mRNA.OKI2018_I69.chr1.g3767.t1.cds [Oikopleura dioica]